MKNRTVTLAVLILLTSVVFIFPRLVSSAEGAASTPEPQRRTPQRRRRPAARRPAQGRPRVDYSRFNHRTKEHQGACTSCHTIPTSDWARAKRPAGEAAFPDVTDYPDHPSCVNCHRNQFFRGARPVICTICHTNVSPRDGTTHPFQNPEEGFLGAKKPKPGSQFTMRFPHDKHQDVMARLTPFLPDAGSGVAFVRASFMQEKEEKRIDSCSICHKTYVHEPKGDAKEVFVKPTPEPFPTPNELKVPAFWLKKGTFKTTPGGHASCFNCHWQEGGAKPLSSDCKECHTLLPQGKTGLFVPREHPDFDPKTAAAMGVAEKKIIEKWYRRDSATFRHEQKDHEKAGCTACHINITSISTLDQKTLKVPILTCSTSNCHGSPKASGGKNIIFLEVDRRRKQGMTFACTKCHVSFGKDKTPDSHEALYPVVAK